jgi:hypothetical protein
MSARRSPSELSLRFLRRLSLPTGQGTQNATTRYDAAMRLGVTVFAAKIAPCALRLLWLRAGHAWGGAPWRIPSGALRHRRGQRQLA